MSSVEMRALASDASQQRRWLLARSERLGPGEVVVMSADGGPVLATSWVTPLARSIIRVDPRHFVWLGVGLFQKFESRNHGRLNADDRAIMVWRDMAGTFVIAVGVVTGSGCEAASRAVFEGYPSCRVSAGEAQF